jgi:hypothetical protein
VEGRKPLFQWLWIAPVLAAAAWSQQGIPRIIPETPVGGFVIPSGTELKVRVDEALSTDRNSAGDPFSATLVDPIMVNGHIVLPGGAHLSGHVLANHQAAILKVPARLVLGLGSFELSGRSFPIQLTAATYEAGHKHRKLKDPDPNV